MNYEDEIRMDDYDEYIIELKNTINELKSRIRLYEISTNLDFKKINKQKEYIDDMEIYVRSLELKNKLLSEQHTKIQEEISTIKKRVEKHI